MIAAILLNDQYKTQDFQYSLASLKQAGCAIAIIAPELKTYYSQDKHTAEPDMLINDIDPEKFDLLIITVKNAKLDSETLKLIQEFSKYNNTILVLGCSIDIIKQLNTDAQKNIIFSENAQDVPKFISTSLEILRKKKQ